MMINMARGWTSAQGRHRRPLPLGHLGVAALCVASLFVPAPAVPTEPSPIAAAGSASTPQVAVSNPAVAAVQTSAPALVATPAPGSSQNMNAFFPSIKGDLTKISWAHAVNSKALLATALNGSVMMLEADVVLGRTPESTADVPVMGHPPETTSDLSLREFIRSVITFNNDHPSARKGIKLDFKSIEVYERALDYLKQEFVEVPAFPVWLNADILPGPVKATAVPVAAARFLQKAKATYPTLMLSLGWTTRWGKAVDDQGSVPAAERKYSDANVNEMISALHQAGVDQPITYAVRAAFVATSLDELKTLLNHTAQASGEATITVWSSDDTDVVDVKQLRSNILALGKTRVYLDVGEKLAKDLDIGSSAVSTAASVASIMLALFFVLLRSL